MYWSSEGVDLLIYYTEIENPTYAWKVARIILKKEKKITICNM